jgi:hypothetical protein
MSNKSDANYELNDRDIAALFDGQKISVPESLDDIILAASRQVQTVTPPPKTSLNKYSPWFAIAAVLVLAVIIGPLVLNAPTSEFQESRRLKNQEININEKMLISQDISMESDEEAAESVDMTPTAKISPDKAPALMALTSPGVKAASRSPLPSSVVSLVPQPLNDNELEYRKMPESWLRTINNLVAAKQLSKAQAEYDLFRKNHPNYRTNFVRPEQ